MNMQMTGRIGVLLWKMQMAAAIKASKLFISLFILCDLM